MLVGLDSTFDREDFLLQELYRVTLSDELAFDGKLERLLDLGRDFFGLQVGILSRIEGERYEVLHVSPAGGIEPGTMFDLSDTYCVLTFRTGVVKAWSPAGESEINTHPCYRQMGLEAYIGTTVFVGGERFGTLNFTSLEPRDTPFTAREETFVELLGHWIGSEVARQRELDRQAELVRDLRQVNEELEDFAYRTSHDLKAPIMRSRRLAEFLIEDLAEGNIDAVEKGLHQIIGQAANLEGLIANMLALVRAQRADEPVQSVDLPQLLAGIKDKLSALIEDNPCRLEFSVDTVGPLMLPPARLVSILENLISNGIKYRDDAKVECNVTVSATSKDDVLVVEVTDNGLGIPVDQQPRAFDSFTRLHPDTSYGTGLGLGIVRQHVERLNGTIELTSEPGAGTTFRVTIPTELTLL